MAEVFRTHKEKLGWQIGIAKSFQTALADHFPFSFVSGHEALVESMTNDPKDRHVLAAAVAGGAPLLLTFNLKDFPRESLEQHDIEVSHPDDYLLVLNEMAPQSISERVALIAGRRDESTEDVLIRLGKALPKFATKLLGELA